MARAKSLPPLFWLLPLLLVWALLAAGPFSPKTASGQNLPWEAASTESAPSKPAPPLAFADGANKNASGDTVANKGGGTVWERITATADNLPNTQVPATFKLKSGEFEFYVNSNATKHFGEYLQNSSMVSNQQMLSSFSSAVDRVTSTGSIKFGQMYKVDGWEIVFSQRAGDVLPVIKHARFAP